MTSFKCSTRLTPVCAILLAALSLSLRAQNNAVLTVAPTDPLTVKRGAAAEVRLKLQLKPGFHVNSDKPADDYLIPLKLTWAKEPLQAEQIAYPKPQMEKYDFSPAPLSVFSGSFEILTHFKALTSAAPGPAIMNGKLRYQACNNKECLPPKNLEVAITVYLQ